MPRSHIPPNGEAVRCSTCHAISIRLPKGRWVKGCNCGTGGFLLGEIPDGLIVVCGERKLTPKMEGCQSGNGTASKADAT